ncbi:MAG: DUF4402 domain-containing protein [Gemmatimonadales bacterium]|nr:MAG: DUF4402 domain-containing protein [Gemmatimonadales bacterium]
MKKVTMILALTAFLAIPAMGSAQAQGDEGVVNATATVIAQLEVAGEEDLRFGDVIPGIASSVAGTDVANAGRFRIQGGGDQQVSLDFDLPEDLDGPGSATMPISFGTSSAGHSANSTAVAGTFNPNTQRLQNLVGGQLYVFIGGTVTPATAQPAGSYSGQITLNVAYTGN